MLAEPKTIAIRRFNEWMIRLGPKRAMVDYGTKDAFEAGYLAAMKDAKNLISQHFIDLRESTRLPESRP